MRWGCKVSKTEPRVKHLLDSNLFGVSQNWDTGYNTGEPRKQHASWRGPMQRAISYLVPFLWSAQKGECRQTESRLATALDEGIGNDSKWVQGIVLTWQEFWVGSKIKLVWWLNNCKFTKSPWKVHLKLVNCIVCKFRFNKAALKKKITYNSKESSYIPKGKAVISEKHVRHRQPERLPLDFPSPQESHRNISSPHCLAQQLTGLHRSMLYCFAILTESQLTS